MDCIAYHALLNFIEHFTRGDFPVQELIESILEKIMQITLKEASLNENQHLQDAITNYNIHTIHHLPWPHSTKIDLTARTATGEWIGGINAEWVNWGILFVSILFIDEKFRGNDCGSFLLNAVESRAISHGCHLAHLDTFDFQAKDFYLTQGYTVFGVLDNCPKGHQRFYLKKELIEIKT
jgi:GNAT superfamily N-acetyltransferase